VRAPLCSLPILHLSAVSRRGFLDIEMKVAERCRSTYKGRRSSPQILLLEFNLIPFQKAVVFTLGADRRMKGHFTRTPPAQEQNGSHPCDAFNRSRQKEWYELRQTVRKVG
jgi:hypothetical protein